MKNITLAMAKELKNNLDRKGESTRFYLTRSADVFIPLRKRVEIARKHNADLFLSVHADSASTAKQPACRFIRFPETASDKEAAALAERENKADVIQRSQSGRAVKRSERRADLAGATRNPQSFFRIGKMFWKTKCANRSN